MDDISCLLKVPRRALHVVGSRRELISERKTGAELGFPPVGHVQRLHLRRPVLHGERRHEDQLQLQSGCCSLLEHQWNQKYPWLGFPVAGTDARACVSLDSRPDMVSSAQFVLIVEKDATFQRLLDDDFCAKLSPCIMITVRFPRGLLLFGYIDPGSSTQFCFSCVDQGKGVPDVNSRLMVRKLWDTLHIPIFALVDADPHGRHLSGPLLPRLFPHA